MLWRQLETTRSKRLRGDDFYKPPHKVLTNDVALEGINNGCDELSKDLKIPSIGKNRPSTWCWC
ncbi:hypothetical protein PILCRDRAFT_817729 [Piloderma croceum F 1598]|uniref:Uncharacterized protein n=1 Tax=Piloderma croceum (strain F 1598) TaxID=765440 RepID=A0A0C3C5G8_PILCF|nr:hypothetical protein PILCRDRAFT_817729 [Piloderma croceum F 1598]